MVKNVVSIFEGQKRRIAEDVRLRLEHLAKANQINYEEDLPPQLLRDAARLVVDVFSMRKTLDEEMEFLGVNFCYGMLVSKAYSQGYGEQIPAVRLKSLAFDMSMVGEEFYPV